MGQVPVSLYPQKVTQRLRPDRSSCLSALSLLLLTFLLDEAALEQLLDAAHLRPALQAQRKCSCRWVGARPFSELSSGEVGLL